MSKKVFFCVVYLVWKNSTERRNVGGGFIIRSRNGALFRKGCVVNGRMTKASNNRVPPPPPISPRLERDAWSMAKQLKGSNKNEYPPPPTPQLFLDPPPVFLAFSPLEGGRCDRAHHEGAQKPRAHASHERAVLSDQVSRLAGRPEEKDRVPHRKRLPRERPQETRGLPLPSMTKADPKPPPALLGGGGEGVARDRLGGWRRERDRDGGAWSARGMGGRGGVREVCVGCVPLR